MQHGPSTEIDVDVPWATIQIAPLTLCRLLST